ncbi:MAG TPA: HipA domain-containing protein [Burkholderiaceae bacterium]|nr:HipA domain-containing protein [Burkholderiaceae bacterium]
MPRPATHTFDAMLDAAELRVRQKVGTLYPAAARTDMLAPFQYDPSWLRNELAFVLDPRLELWNGEQYPPADTPAFGIFMDSAPDRWGRVLMERSEAAAARREGRAMRCLQDLDFLLCAHDLTRIGALRFRISGNGRFLDNAANAAPPASSLAELAHISRRIEEPGAENLREYEGWLAMLGAPGSSLGGARPKANFSDRGNRLWIAKFPALDDRYDVGRWELVAHRLAGRAGVRVPQSRLEQLGDGYGSFCVARFDRVPGSRRMYASAMTLLERHDDEAGGSYLDIAEFILDHGATDHIGHDLEQLFRRAVFNVLIGNRDDHLRNHGFTLDRNGWRLSDAFDMNPNGAQARHALTFDGCSAEPNVATVVKTAELYRLDGQRARNIVTEVRAAVSGWRDEAARQGLPESELRRMEAVIEA